MNILSNHNRLLRGAPIPTEGGDVYNSGWEYTPQGEISGYSGSAFYQQECPCDSAAIVDSAFNKSTAWVDGQNYLTAHQDVTNLPYIQNSALEFSPQSLISGISGSGFYATSAEGALNAETANFAYNAEYADSAQTANFASYSLSSNRSDVANYASSAGIIANGWEYDETSAITAYNGSAFAGRDWTDDITAASSNAYNSAVNWVVDQHYLTAVTGDNTPYSAGANIDITNHIVSGKDWTTEIQNASSYAVDQATAQIPTVTGLPYVENSALNYTPGGHLVSSISGDAIYAVSAECAFTAETANYAYVAESANYVDGGWEYDASNNITGYSGSAFAATGEGKVYDGVAPIVVNNVEDKISANIIELSAGSGIDITETANKVVISCTGAGSNDNLKFSNILGGADNGPASAQIELDRIQSPFTMTYYQMVLDNEGGSHKSFTLIPTDIGSGLLYAVGNGPITTANINSSPIWCYAFSTGTPSVTTTKSGDYKEVHLSTPYDYNGPSMFTASIDGQNFVLSSGAYANMVWQNVEGTDKWCLTDSGYYDI